MLTHRNWRASLDAIRAVTTLGPGDTIYIYLPLAHMFSRMVQLVAFETGATPHYFGGDIRNVVTELATVAPTHLPSVPRLFEKVYPGFTVAPGTDSERGPGVVKPQRAAATRGRPMTT